MLIVKRWLLLPETDAQRTVHWFCYGEQYKKMLRLCGDNIMPTFYDEVENVPLNIPEFMGFKFYWAESWERHGITLKIKIGHVIARKKSSCSEFALGAVGCKKENCGHLVTLIKRDILKAYNV